jgi:hypothetical protein
MTHKVISTPKTRTPRSDGAEIKKAKPTGRTAKVGETKSGSSGSHGLQPPPVHKTLSQRRICLIQTKGQADIKAVHALDKSLEFRAAYRERNNEEFNPNILVAAWEIDYSDAPARPTGPPVSLDTAIKDLGALAEKLGKVKSGIPAGVDMPAVIDLCSRLKSQLEGARQDAGKSSERQKQMPPPVRKDKVETKRSAGDCGKTAEGAQWAAEGERPASPPHLSCHI